MAPCINDTSFKILKTLAFFLQVAVEEVIVHEKYGKSGIPKNDIALLRLQKAVELNVGKLKSSKFFALVACP